MTTYLKDLISNLAGFDIEIYDTKHVRYKNNQNYDVIKGKYDVEYFLKIRW